jgi:hypothetical protein
LTKIFEKEAVWAIISTMLDDPFKQGFRITNAYTIVAPKLYCSKTLFIIVIQTWSGYIDFTSHLIFLS